MNKKKIRVSDIFFLFGYMLYIIYRILYSSAYITILGSTLRQGLKVLLICALFMSILVNLRISKKNAMLFIMVLSVAFLTYFFCKSIDIVCIMLMLVSSYKTDFNNIIKICFFTNIFMLILVLCGSVTGVIPDYTYSHYSLITKQWEKIHAYGFLHYSTPAFIILYLSIIILYLHQSKMIYGILAVINFGTFYLFSAKLPFFVFCIIGVLFVWKNGRTILFRINNISKFIFQFTPFIAAIITFILCELYSKGGTFWKVVNDLFSNRLSQGNLAIKRNGIHFFGTYFDMGGVYSIKYGNLRGVDMSNYFFIDNDYLLMLLRYGVALSCIVFLIYGFILTKSITCNEKIIFVWCLATLIFAMVNSILINVEYNPLIFWGVKAITLNTNNRLGDK